MGGIYNRTSRKALCEDFELLSTLFGRMRGLMFRLSIRKPLLFVFDRGRERPAAACAIHSLFVFFSFSAIYLDSEKRVIASSVCPPFLTLFSPKKPAAYLIEGEPGLAKMAKEGDLLEF
ncbi:MAG: hypothetical protein WC759_03690 [Candidatus Micrarchaeia archaeon]